MDVFDTFENLSDGSLVIEKVIDIHDTILMTYLRHLRTTVRSKVEFHIGYQISLKDCQIKSQ